MLKNLFIIISLFFTLLHSQELKDVSLQLKWKYQFQFAGFIVAKEKGFYKDVGLYVELKEFHTGIEIVNDVKKGTVDFGISDSSLVYDALSNNSLTAIMAIFQHSPFILMGLKSEGIEKLEDIHWQKLALYEGIDDIAVRAMLKSKNIIYEVKPPVFTLDKLLSGKIDMMTAYISNEPYIAKEKNIEVIIFAPKDYGFEGYGDILFTSKEMIKNSPEVVQKMYEATYKGWDYAFSHIDEIVDLIYEKYNTLDKTKDALRYEANILKQLSGYGKNFGQLSDEKIRSIAQLFNLLKNENNKLDKLDNFIYQLPKEINLSNAKLTQQEKQYIKDKKTINVCLKNHQEPLVIKEKHGYEGISIDFLDLISKSTNLKLNYIYSNSMEDYLNGVKNGKCDMLSMVVTQPNRHKFLTPTIACASDTLVVATAIDTPYLSDINDLKNEKIMVQKDAKNLIRYIKTIHPNLNLVEVEKIDLERVVSGEFYGTVGGSYLLAYQIASSYSLRLKIMTKIGENIDGSFGVSNREPLLLSILNKEIAHILPSTKQKIMNSYKSIRVEEHTDYLLILQIVAISMLLIAISVLLYFREKRLNKTIKEEKNKFKNIFYKASDGVSILKDGVFIDCNDSLVKLLGYKNQNQILNHTPAQLSPEYQPDGKKSLDTSILMMQIAKENGINHFEWKYIRADGEEFWSDIMLTDISTKDDETMMHVVWRDIQDRKELEEKLIGVNVYLEEKVEEEIEKNRQQQLIMMQQSRYAQMGEMISMVAHQWRQPLNSLSLIIQSTSLKHKLGKLDDEMMLKLSTDSQKQITQMSQTINDFRYFFRPDKQAEMFKVDASVRHALKLLTPIFKEKGIVVKTHLEEDVTIIGFSNELGQVLINILNNAKDALVENNSDKGKYITVVLKKEDTKVVISIEDNAGGIADDIIDKIFNPYFSTKEEKNGTGLGLYMSKSIIEEHSNGILSVENSSHGATFKIVLGDDSRKARRMISTHTDITR